MPGERQGTQIDDIFHSYRNRLMKRWENFETMLGSHLGRIEFVKLLIEISS